MRRIPSAKIVVSRAAAAETQSKVHRPGRALAVLAALPMSMRPRMQTGIIAARLRSKAARIPYPVKKLFPRRLLRHRRILHRLPLKRWQALFLKQYRQQIANSPTPRERHLCRLAPDVRRVMWQRQRTMQHPRQEKQRQAHRIITQELCSPARTARSRRIRSRNRPYIPSRNPTRAAARRCKIAVGLFCPVRQEKRQAKIRRAVPVSRPAAQESRITRDRRYRPSLHNSAAPLCRLRTWRVRSQQQTIPLCQVLRDPAWQENSQLPIRQTLLVPHRPAIPQEMACGRSNRAVRRIRQYPVRQERTSIGGRYTQPVQQTTRVSANGATQITQQNHVSAQQSNSMAQPSNGTRMDGRSTNREHPAPATPGFPAAPSSNREAAASPRSTARSDAARSAEQRASQRPILTPSGSAEKPVSQTGAHTSPASVVSSERQSRKPTAPAAMGSVIAPAPASQESRGPQRSTAVAPSAKRPAPQERQAGMQKEPQKKDQTL